MRLSMTLFSIFFFLLSPILCSYKEEELNNLDLELEMITYNLSNLKDESSNETLLFLYWHPRAEKSLKNRTQAFNIYELECLTDLKIKIPISNQNKKDYQYNWRFRSKFLIKNATHYFTSTEIKEGNGEFKCKVRRLYKKTLWFLSFASRGKWSNEVSLMEKKSKMFSITNYNLNNNFKILISLSPLELFLLVLFLITSLCFSLNAIFKTGKTSTWASVAIDLMEIRLICRSIKNKLYDLKSKGKYNKKNVKVFVIQKYIEEDKEKICRVEETEEENTKEEKRKVLHEYIKEDLQEETQKMQQLFMKEQKALIQEDIKSLEEDDELDENSFEMVQH